VFLPLLLPNASDPLDIARGAANVLDSEIWRAQHGQRFYFLPGTPSSISRARPEWAERWRGLAREYDGIAEEDEDDDHIDDDDDVSEGNDEEK